MEETSVYDSDLRHAIARALERLSCDLVAVAPDLASRVESWTDGLAGNGTLAGYFTHDEAFPMLLVPWWIETRLSRTHDLPFHEDLTYSSVNGYLLIRLIDNLMDGDETVERGLLPAIAFFHTQFHAVYHRYFPPRHAFWSHFTAIWFRAAEAAVLDAEPTLVDHDRFVRVAARKVSAAKIPVAAVCHRHGADARVGTWCQVIDQMGAFHQMLNDLFDWHNDLTRGRPSYFLSEGRRRARADESIESWVIREGFAWGTGLLDDWLAALEERAADLAAPDMASYLAMRRRRLEARRRDVVAGFDQLRRLTATVAAPRAHP